MNENIKKARKDQGLTQYELETRAGVPHGIVTKIETGQVVCAKHFDAVCAALELPVPEYDATPPATAFSTDDLREELGIIGAPDEMVIKIACMEIQRLRKMLLASIG